MTKLKNLNRNLEKKRLAMAKLFEKPKKKAKPKSGKARRRADERARVLEAELAEMERAYTESRMAAMAALKAKNDAV